MSRVWPLTEKASLKESDNNKFPMCVTDREAEATGVIYRKQSRMTELASGMRQLAGTGTRYRRADAAPLTGLISHRTKYTLRAGRIGMFCHGWIRQNLAKINAYLRIRENPATRHLCLRET